MKHIIGLLAMLWPILSAAQSPPVKALSIGDTVPDVTITNVYNYPASTIRLSDLKGKLVILDFWSTWCGACIGTFPKIHQLQKEFGDPLQFILIDTYQGDSIEKVKPFFDKRQKRTGLSVTLPYSLQQSRLEKYFPFNIVPHYVWIDKNGLVVAITSQIEVNKENIQSALKGNTASLHVKKDVLDYDIQKTLVEDLVPDEKTPFLYRSLLTGYKEGVSGADGIGRDANGKIVRLYALNHDLRMLLRIAYPEELNVPPNRILYRANNSQNLNQDITSGVEFYTKTYCYDLVTPPSSMDVMQKYMQQDLLRFFHTKVSQELITTQCLIVRAGSQVKRISTKNGVSTMDVEPGSLRKYISNLPTSQLMNVLNNHPAFKNIPVIDDTGIQNHIDIQFPSNLYELNLQSLILFLKKCGFNPSLENRELLYSIITDRN